MDPDGSWEAPPRCQFKLNWDAALDKVQCKVGIGAILRDWGGHCTGINENEEGFIP